MGILLLTVLSKNTNEVWWLNPGVVPTPTDFIGLKNALSLFLESKNDSFWFIVNVLGSKKIKLGRWVEMRQVLEESD